MRLIFLFFVALNAVFFFWQSGGISGQVKHAEKDLTAIPVNVNKLVLVGETEDKQAARAATKTTKDPGKKEQSKTDKLQTAALTAPLPPQKRTAKNYTCYAMGPFKETTQATPIALKLRELGAITDSRRNEKQVPTGYWVYLPPFETWKEARQKVMTLESSDMKDMFIMGRGAMKNAVSVGLFTSEKSARKRMSRLVELGENPKMQTQYSKTPEFWIDIDVDSSQKQVASAIEAIAKGLTLLELVERDCKK